MALARSALFTKLAAVSLAVLLLATLGVLASTEPVNAARRSRYTFTHAEKCMMRKINRRRSNHGLRRLDWDRQLGYVARRHARKMARNGTIFHDDGLGYKVTRWRSLGQNVGTGEGCRNLFKTFLRSAPHRANILGSWRFVGVGSKRRNGRLYVMHVFESRHNPGNVYSYP